MECGTIKKVRKEKAKIMIELKTLCGRATFISGRGDMLLSGNISSINVVKLG